MTRTTDLSWRQTVDDDGSQPPLSLQNVHVSYRTRRGSVQAVRGVTLDLQAGESLALIGESGSGKTTLGLGIVRLLVDTAEVSPGEIIYRRDGRELDVLFARRRTAARVSLARLRHGLSVCAERV